MIVKLLTEHHLEFLSLKRGYGGSSESTHVKMPHCWKSHATANLGLKWHSYQLDYCLPKVGAFESRKCRRRFWNNGTPAGTNMSEPVESLSSIISESPYFCNKIVVS